MELNLTKEQSIKFDKLLVKINEYKELWKVKFQNIYLIIKRN